MIVKEIIVVEGKSDTEAIRRALEADTIETNGSRVSRQTIEAIRRACERRGVIVFTDPDFPGERIRKIISRQVPGCKHAFITRSQGRGALNESLGIEHASPAVIREALSKVYTQFESPDEQISMQMLRDYGLLGGAESRRLREQLGDLLKIGYTNGKQLYKRLRMFRITPEELDRAMAAVNRGGSAGE
ncbi:MULTISPECIES: ribonuclease M5 [unclassified Sporolactobacillus]|uniref:ribonuclease M5 n=1 Tax=unclassified Sporolactobacillus TaxID=2628533 RepID=UPI0023676BFC|nr:ribonuclease M5 [Sporolactobacillus sp. CQH2019]MDD9150683.1 ribonuclease M5 [Sporolactobacillus sp. CQH2019]